MPVFLRPLTLLAKRGLACETRSVCLGEQFSACIIYLPPTKLWKPNMSISPSSILISFVIHAPVSAEIASCPGSLRGRKVELGTHCLRMLSSSRISGGLETSGYYSIILSVYHRITVRCTRVAGELYAPWSFFKPCRCLESDC